MPSQLRQFNVRLTDEDEARLERVLPALKEAYPGVVITQSLIFRISLIELERKLAPAKGGKKK